MANPSAVIERERAAREVERLDKARSARPGRYESYNGSTRVTRPESRTEIYGCSRGQNGGAAGTVGEGQTEEAKDCVDSSSWQ